MISKDPYQIPLHENHPIMTKDVITAYEKVLSYSNLKLHQQIGHRNVKIEQNQYIHQIFTKNSQRLPHLVFLHGYGGTSITALRIFQHLFNYFQIHALDTYGIGFSSRGNFSDQFNQDQTTEYYVQALQKWRKSSKINKFHLVGHSFGGYLATLYASKYPNRVSHLHLISPAGVNQRQAPQQGMQLTFKQKMFYSFAQKIYGCSIRPSKAMTNFFFGNKIMNSVLSRLGIPQQQHQDWRKYFNHINSQDHSSQTGFYKIFKWPLNPKVTIQNIIRSSNFPFFVDFYFGDYDWMHREGAKKLVNQHFKGVRLSTIPNAGHQLVFNNPAYLCKKIIENSQNVK